MAFCKLSHIQYLQSMHVGWRYFIKQRLKKRADSYSVGIEFGRAGVQVAVLGGTVQQPVWQFQQHINFNGWAEQLADYVEAQGLRNALCHVALVGDLYHLQQIERPQVADEEMHQALTWSAKELLSAQEDMVLDYFVPPAQSGGADKLNLVTATHQDIAEICAGMEKSGLTISSIGIGELAICNLLGAQQEAAMILLQTPGQDLCLSIVKDAKLFFSRRLKGYENLPTFNPQELQMGVLDNLSVEIQRSMDYFESQLRQAPVRKLFIGIDTSAADNLCTQLQQLTLMQVAPLVPCVEKSDELTFGSSNYISLGAALTQGQDK